MEHDYELYTVGPVQFALGIRDSISCALRSMEGGDKFTILVVQLPYVLLPGCGPWERILEGVLKDQWPAWRERLQTSAWADEKNGLIWRIQEWPVLVSDRAGTQLTVHVFCPSSQTMGYMPYADTEGFVRFRSIPGYSYSEKEKSVLETQL